MINFTVGPVQSSEAVRAIGAEQVPYFRTAEFSELMFENESLVKKFANATEDSRVVFITGSGSAGMETAIMNTLTPKDKAIVVNGGSFGERFVELLTLHEIPFTEIKLEPGKALKPEHLAELNLRRGGRQSQSVRFPPGTPGTLWFCFSIGCGCRGSSQT